MSTAKVRRRARAQRRRMQLLRELCWRPRPCEIHWDDGCQGVATDPHEPLLRARGGAIDDPDNIVLSCDHCHEQVHRFPEEATRRGWMIPAVSGNVPELASSVDEVVSSWVEVAAGEPDPF